MTGESLALAAEELKAESTWRVSSADECASSVCGSVCGLQVDVCIRG